MLKRLAGFLARAIAQQTTPPLARRLENISRLIHEQNILQRAALLGPERVISFYYADNGFKIWLPYCDSDYIQQQILATATFFEEKMLRDVTRHLAPGGIFLNVGANIGNHSLYFSGVCGAEIVYAIEPQKVAFECLEKNLALNGIVNVVAINKVTGSRPGRQDLTGHKANNIGKGQFSFNADGRYEAICLDDLELPALNLVKIDVEGSEVDVIDGLAKTISRCHPLILVEITDENKVNATERLHELGYDGSHLGQENYLFFPTDTVYGADN